MKITLSLLGFLLVISANAKDVDCAGMASVPQNAVSDLRSPACIAWNGEMGLAVVAGDSGLQQVVRAFQVDSAGGTHLIDEATLSDAKPDTVPYYAFSNSCGLAISTARIASEKEVVLIYDPFNTITALKWNLNRDGASKLQTLVSTFDANRVYFCNGVLAGIDTDLESVDFDQTNRTLTIRKSDGSDSKTIQF